MNVLIVEDDHVLSLMLQKMVERIDCTVINCVTTGEQAVEIARNNGLDLILMDIMLEGSVDGIEAMKMIQEKHNIPVIYVTGNSDPTTIKRAQETNYTEYLVKPIIFDKLSKTIDTLR